MRRSVAPLSVDARQTPPAGHAAALLDNHFAISPPPGTFIIAHAAEAHAAHRDAARRRLTDIDDLMS
jgi:hypothetical protein